MASDEVTVDLTGYKDRVGGRVTPGRYRVVVDDAEVDKSGAGNVMINVWLRITGGEFDGTVIIDRLTQTEKALFRTVNFMQGIGLPTPHKRLKVNIRAWVGKVLMIDVEDGEPYLGRIKSEVRGYERIRKQEGETVADLPMDLPADLNGMAEFAGPSADPGPAAGADDPWAMPSTDEVSVSVPDEVDLDKLDLG